MNQKFADILVVDDDPLVLMNYCDILEDNGFNPLGAENLIQAFNRLDSRTFDLVVCDHDLTDGKGVELVEKIVSSGRDENVIYLSAAPPAVLQKISRMSPVKKVLSKPASPESLLEAVNEFREVRGIPDSYPRLIGDDEREMLLGDF
jgi:DNA-binding response OmpR family regulator